MKPFQYVGLCVRQHPCEIYKKMQTLFDCYHDRVAKFVIKAILKYSILVFPTDAIKQRIISSMRKKQRPKKGKKR